ncbi:MAG: site-specific integrase [Chloroflexi bacterium]|nr:site-specific integrase [Chloroflexota bacterium]
MRPRTISNYLGDTRRFAKRTNNQSPRKVTAVDVREFILEYQQTHAPKTVREMQLALRKFFRFLVAEGEIARDPTASIKLMPYRVTPQPTYSEAEVKQLLLVCETRTLTGARDRAIITVLYDTAVREGELVSMGLPDWELRRVRVSGKTGTRDVPLGLTALQAIDR